MQLCFVSVHGPRETYFVDEPCNCGGRTFQLPGDKFNSQEVGLVVFAFEEVGLGNLGGVGDVSAGGVTLTPHGVLVVVQTRHEA
jgi:hypothetical protein